MFLVPFQLMPHSTTIIFDGFPMVFYGGSKLPDASASTSQVAERSVSPRGWCRVSQGNLEMDARRRFRRDSEESWDGTSRNPFKNHDIILDYDGIMMGLWWDYGGIM